jgi:hypothetical protein
LNEVFFSLSEFFAKDFMSVSECFFGGEISQLGELFLIKKNTKKLTCDFWVNFSPFFDIKIIKLATSRPRHFRGCHFVATLLEKCFSPLRTVAI